MGFRGHEFAFASPAQAVEAMASRLALVCTERCRLSGARGRVLAEAIRADRDSPAFDYSAMDGFALRAADASGAPLEIAGESRIGKPPPVLPPGRVALRIATGAPMPIGADAIVKREDVIEDAACIRIEGAARVVLGQHVRRRGENAHAGDVLLGTGALLSASSIGTLAAVGAVSPLVYRRVRVGIIATGDELVEAGRTPSEFEIRNSNATALFAAAGSLAWMEPAAPMIARDEEAEVEAALRIGLGSCDAVILSGGVSMGHRDPVRAAVERIGASILFHGLPQRPGKPMLGAVTSDGKTIFGLPGNPLSSLVTFTRIVVPALSGAAGVKEWPAPPRERIVNADDATIDLWWHRLVTRDGEGVRLFDVRGSGDVVAGGRSDGFIEVAPGERSIEAPFFAWPT